MKSLRMALFVSLVGASVLAGCSREESAGERETLQLALNWKAEPQFGGFYEARERGAFDRHGLKVEILPGGSGTPVAQMVAAGQAPFGIASGDEVILARARGADIVAIFAVFQTNPQGIMVHRSRGMKEIGDVFREGGTLAMQRGLPYADYLEKKYGFDRVRVVPYLGGIGPFLNDANFMQQCFVVSEPLTAERAGSDPQAFLIADAGYNPYTTVVITQGEYARRHPETVRAMALACREGWRSYLDDPRGTNAVMGAINPSMDQETFASAAAAQKPLIETDFTNEEGLGAMERARWQTLAEQLLELKAIETLPEIDACFVSIKP